MRKTRALVVASLPLLVFGCVSEPDRAAARASSSDPPSARRIITPERRGTQAAMAAVYAHVLGGSGRRLGFQPISLERAAQILRQRAQHSRAGRMRQIIAIARVADVALRIDPHSSEPDFEPIALEKFLLPLAGREGVEAMKDAVRRELGRPERRDSGESGYLAVLYESAYTTVGPACSYLLGDVVLTTIQSDNTVAESVCDREEGDDAWKSGMVWATTEFRIQRPLGELAALFDPQSWDHRPPEACHEPSTQTCGAYFECACVLGEPNQCDDCPPAAGSAWTALFAEAFVMTWDPVSGDSSGFYTKLAVDSAPGAGEYRMEYCLDEVQKAWVGSNHCYVSQSKCIDVDEGFTKIETEDDGWHRFEGHKMLHFDGWGNESTDSALNAHASVLLMGMGDEAVVQACCAVPEDPSCLGPPGRPFLLP